MVTAEIGAETAREAGESSVAGNCRRSITRRAARDAASVSAVLAENAHTPGAYALKPWKCKCSS